MSTLISEADPVARAAWEKAWSEADTRRRLARIALETAAHEFAEASKLVDLLKASEPTAIRVSFPGDFR